MQKIGLVGYGYWGKILFNNLCISGHNNVIICDPFCKEDSIEGYGLPIFRNYTILNKCSHVFVASPPTKHYDICKKLLENGISVFCEKPPTTDSKTTIELYDIAKKYNANFFVDWTFLFNDSIWVLKDYIMREGPPHCIIMNRMNFGPVRTDVSAKYDLASHDVSILNYLLEDLPLKKVSWYEYNFIGGEKEDTCLGLIEYKNGTIVQINTSWSAHSKIRLCYFNFNNKTATWDDSLKLLNIGNYQHRSISSPLVNAIDTFLSTEEKIITREKHRKISEETMEMLEW